MQVCMTYPCRQTADGHCPVCNPRPTVTIHQSHAGQGVCPACGKDFAEETVTIPKSAIAWLFGEGPDPDGKWFSECEDAIRAAARKHTPAYWWRSHFRKLIGQGLKYDKERRTIVPDLPAA